MDNPEIFVPTASNTPGDPSPDAEGGGAPLELGIYPTPQGVAFDLTGGENPLIFSSDDVGRIIMNLINANVMHQMQRMGAQVAEKEQLERVRRLLETGGNTGAK